MSPQPGGANPDLEVATLRGMPWHKADSRVTGRSVFIIDPNKKMRFTCTCPPRTGRNVDEVLRVLDALQLPDGRKLTTPVNWKPDGRKTLKPHLRRLPAPKDRTTTSSPRWPDPIPAPATGPRRSMLRSCATNPVPARLAQTFPAGTDRAAMTFDPSSLHPRTANVEG